MNPQIPSDAPEHEHVFRFRIYSYRNGLGQTVYKAKEPISWLGGLMWDWVTEDEARGIDAWTSDILVVATRKHLDDLLLTLCERRVARAAKTDTMKRRRTLKLITIEDVSVRIPIAS